MEKIKILAPATVANLSCGYDVLGVCLSYIGDEMVITKVAKKGIKIIKMEGFSLPKEAFKNAAGVAALALIEKTTIDFGFEIEIIKKVKPGSGIGSSASSAAGVVVGINYLLGNPFSKTELVHFAMEGERIACGSAIADNVAPAIFGGFTLVKSTNPLQVLSLPTPKDLFMVILHPQIEIKTADSRAVLPKDIPLIDAVKQWGNVGSLVSALYENNYDLLSSSLEDVVVEPYRSKLIPFFNQVKQISLENGSLGCGISGSGPSIFSLCKGKEVANKVLENISTFYNSTSIEFHIFITKVNEKGVKIIEK
jgi:homoserine kinase